MLQPESLTTKPEPAKFIPEDVLDKKRKNEPEDERLKKESPEARIEQGVSRAMQSASNQAEGAIKDFSSAEKGKGEQGSFLARIKGTYQAITDKFSSFKEKTHKTFSELSHKAESKWAGRALMAIPKIAAIPLKFVLDVCRAGVNSVENSAKINSLEGVLNGKDSPDKLFRMMNLSKDSEEAIIIMEALNSSDRAMKEKSLDILARRIGIQSQIDLHKKTRFTNYLNGRNPEIPKSVTEANARMEMIYLKHGVNPQDYASCKALEEKLKKEKGESDYKKLLALKEQIIREKNNEEPATKGEWNFSRIDSSLSQKAKIAANSFKKGMLWHLINDPGEIAGLATCTINGEYIGNLANHKISDVLTSKSMQTELARDLLMLKNQDKLSPETRKRMEAAFRLAPGTDRAEVIKKQSAAGFFAASYFKKQYQTMAYLGTRAFIGVGVDAYKYFTGKHKESVLASEIYNSGLAEQYAEVMANSHRGDKRGEAEMEKMKSEMANEFGYRLMQMESGGAEIAVAKLVDNLLVKNGREGKATDEEIQFLRKYEEFMSYQADRGRVDSSRLNRIRNVVGQYKIEMGGLGKVDKRKLDILNQEGYDASEYACRLSGNWIRDLKTWWKEGSAADEKYKEFRKKNLGNLFAGYLGYQTDRILSLGFNQFGADFGGAIALEHHLLEHIGAGTTAMLNKVPGIGEKPGDFYSIAKAATETAGKVMSVDFITGGVLQGPVKFKSDEKTEREEEKAINPKTAGEINNKVFSQVMENVKASSIVAEINQAREKNEKMTEEMMHDATEFIQNHKVPLVIMAAAGGIMAIKNNPALIKAIGEKAKTVGGALKAGEVWQITKSLALSGSGKLILPNPSFKEFGKAFGLISGIFTGVVGVGAGLVYTIDEIDYQSSEAGKYNKMLKEKFGINARGKYGVSRMGIETLNNMQKSLESKDLNDEQIKNVMRILYDEHDKNTRDWPRMNAFQKMLVQTEGLPYIKYDYLIDVAKKDDSEFNERMQLIEKESIEREQLKNLKSELLSAAISYFNIDREKTGAELEKIINEKMDNSWKEKLEKLAGSGGQIERSDFKYDSDITKELKEIIFKAQKGILEEELGEETAKELNMEMIMPVYQMTLFNLLKEGLRKYPDLKDGFIAGFKSDAGSRLSEVLEIAEIIKQNPILNFSSAEFKKIASGLPGEYEVEILKYLAGKEMDKRQPIREAIINRIREGESIYRASATTNKGETFEDLLKRDFECSLRAGYGVFNVGKLDKNSFPDPAEYEKAIIKYTEESSGNFLKSMSLESDAIITDQADGKWRIEVSVDSTGRLDKIVAENTDGENITTFSPDAFKKILADKGIINIKDAKDKSEAAEKDNEKIDLEREKLSKELQAKEKAYLKAMKKAGSLDPKSSAGEKAAEDAKAKEIEVNSLKERLDMLPAEAGEENVKIYDAEAEKAVTTNQGQVEKNKAEKAESGAGESSEKPSITAEVIQEKEKPASRKEVSNALKKNGFTDEQVKELIIELQKTGQISGPADEGKAFGRLKKIAELTRGKEEFTAKELLRVIKFIDNDESIKSFEQTLNKAGATGKVEKAGPEKIEKAQAEAEIKELRNQLKAAYLDRYSDLDEDTKAKLSKTLDKAVNSIKPEDLKELAGIAGETGKIGADDIEKTVEEGGPVDRRLYKIILINQKHFWDKIGLVNEHEFYLTKEDVERIKNIDGNLSKIQGLKPAVKKEILRNLYQGDNNTEDGIFGSKVEMFTKVMELTNGKKEFGVKFLIESSKNLDEAYVADLEKRVSQGGLTVRPAAKEESGGEAKLGEQPAQTGEKTAPAPAEAKTATVEEATESLTQAGLKDEEAKEVIKALQESGKIQESADAAKAFARVQRIAELTKGKKGLGHEFLVKAAKTGLDEDSVKSLEYILNDKHRITGAGKQSKLRKAIMDNLIKTGDAGKALATYYAGEGAEHVLRRQIEANPDKFDFNKTLDDFKGNKKLYDKALREFSGKQAHVIALKGGIIEQLGKEKTKEVYMARPNSLAIESTVQFDDKGKITEAAIELSKRIVDGDKVSYEGVLKAVNGKVTEGKSLAYQNKTLAEAIEGDKAGKAKVIDLAAEREKRAKLLEQRKLAEQAKQAEKLKQAAETQKAVGSGIESQKGEKKPIILPGEGGADDYGSTEQAPGAARGIPGASQDTGQKSAEIQMRENESAVLRQYNINPKDYDKIKTMTAAEFAELIDQRDAGAKVKVPHNGWWYGKKEKHSHGYLRDIIKANKAETGGMTVEDVIKKYGTGGGKITGANKVRIISESKPVGTGDQLLQKVVSEKVRAGKSVESKGAGKDTLVNVINDKIIDQNSRVRVPLPKSWDGEKTDADKMPLPQRKIEALDKITKLSSDQVKNIAGSIARGEFSKEEFIKYCIERYPKERNIREAKLSDRLNKSISQIIRDPDFTKNETKKAREQVQTVLKIIREGK